MKKLRSLFYLFTFLFFSITFLNSCTEKSSNLEKHLAELTQDGQISTENLAELIAFIKLHADDRKFSKFFTNQEFDLLKLEAFLKKSDISIDTNSNDIEQKIVNIYIENSGSMFGFVTGNTRFKNALTQLIVQLKTIYPEENIKLNFINRQITPQVIMEEISYYPTKLSSNIGDKDSGNSDINEIFRQILEQTSNDQISILLSDCIYSLPRDPDVDGALKIQKSLTQGVFQKILQNQPDLSTIMVQQLSDFNGTYYTKDNKKIALNKIEIPYYIFIIGKSRPLEQISFSEKLDGFQNQIVLNTADYSLNNFYSLVQTPQDIGHYKLNRDNKNTLDSATIQSIKEIRLRDKDKNPFTFSLIVDFDHIPVGSDYLLDKNNYTIEQGDYKIISIEPFDKKLITGNASQNLEKNKKSPTHLIVLEATSAKYSNLTLSLNKNIPSWVYQWHTNDDSQIKTTPNQTFGLKYLLEGISEAYKTVSPNKDYMTLNISITK